jgi:hypothetical protein
MYCTDGFWRFSRFCIISSVSKITQSHIGNDIEAEIVHEKTALSAERGEDADGKKTGCYHRL